MIMETVISCNNPDTSGPVKLNYVDFLKNNPKQFSQFDEEVIIRHFFNDRSNGFYVDVGCAEAHESTTTYYLEKNLGWTGIGIDALEGFRNSWKTYRPKSKFISVAVTDHSGDTITFYEAGPVSSIDKNWAGNFDSVGRPIEVKTMTLNDILGGEGVKKINLLSMDIEGAEAVALSGFDIERYQPELICIEYHTNEGKILNYFDKHGYERIEEYVPHDIANWYFRPKKK
jgi:FkbM family methyltransferase